MHSETRWILGAMSTDTLRSETTDTQYKSNMGSFIFTNSPLYKETTGKDSMQIKYGQFHSYSPLHKGLPKSPDRYTASRDIHTNLRNKHGIGKVKDMLMTLGNYRVRGGAHVEEGTKRIRKLDCSTRGI